MKIREIKILQFAILIILLKNFFAKIREIKILQFFFFF